MIYEITHLTIYNYEAPVASATLALRLTPRQERYQRVRKHHIDVLPRPVSTHRYFDFYRNVVHTVTIAEPHVELRVRAVTNVEVDVVPAPSAPDIAWEEVARTALMSRDLSGLAPTHFLFASPRIDLSQDVTAYARESFSPGGGFLQGCFDLAQRIKADFVYEPETTDVSTPPAEAFLHRRGVCQDFAHIMIAGLRGLGLPAAYVSGYLRTVPPPGQKRLQGADATHAWVSVWAGAASGWLGFDPTNALRTGTDHVTVAIGRDFSDVSPVHGVFVGSGENELKVEVDVIPIEGA